MRLEVLHVPDCPQLPLLLKNLERITHLPVTTTMIDSVDRAAGRGMNGSPTLLIDDVDAFLPSDAVRRAGGLSCRLYQDRLGRPVPVPTVDQLRDAIADRSPFPRAYLR